MAPVLYSSDMARDKERLVNNVSINSFIAENNELTITKSIGDRKYSTLCFKPTHQNTIDIVITKGEYRDGQAEVMLHEMGSQDIRRKYSKKAKLSLALVCFLLFAMVIIVVFILITEHSRALSNSNSIVDIVSTSKTVHNESLHSSNYTETSLLMSSPMSSLNSTVLKYMY